MITEIVSFDGNAFAPDYECGFVVGSEPRLPGASVEMLERIGAWPVIVALQRKPHRLALLIRIVGTDTDGLRSQLFRWFDPEDETPKILIGENHDGVEMYVEALCEELRVYGDQQHDSVFVATLAMNGDVRWRAVTETTDTWSITASGQTQVIDNTGEDEAYPVLTITPTGAKTGGYAYKCYVLVTWRGLNAGTRYPIRLGPLATNALVGAGKMQADGDDLRVFVDGIEVTRHLVDINTANTYIWFAANWQAAKSSTLSVAIAGAGSVDSIAVASVSGWPSSGVVRIDNEVFTYEAVDTVGNRLTGVERAAWGTSAGAHSVAAAVYWMQHEVVVVYGLATATAPTIPTNDIPVFSLVAADSSNTSWKFEIFGQVGYPGRPAAWGKWGNLTTDGNGGVYSATEETLSDTTYTVAGAWLGAIEPTTFGWYLSNPCGIVNAAWADGKKRAYVKEDFAAHLMYWVRGASFWTYQATLADPAVDWVWEAWSQGAGAAWAAADTLAIRVFGYWSDVEAGTVTVTLNSSQTPVTTIGSELGNYTLAATITNTTTDEAITVGFEMALNEDLEIDTDQRTVTYDLDASNQFQAVELDSARRAWLRLVPGNNTLRFDDTGTAAVTVVSSFPRRYY